VLTKISASSPDSSIARLITRPSVDYYNLFLETRPIEALTQTCGGVAETTSSIFGKFGNITVVERNADSAMTQYGSGSRVNRTCNLPNL
jgi:hypothetical protein